MVLSDLESGVIVGAAGGAVAGLILWMVSRLNQYEIDWRERRRMYRWLDKVTAADNAKKWRSTRSIASYTNLTEDRVRSLCSEDARVVLSSGQDEVWGIRGRARDADATGQVS